MLVDARLQNQEEENEIAENGLDFDVNIPIETNNRSNVGNGTLPAGTTQQSHDNSQFIVDNDGMVDFRNGIKSRHNMIRDTPDLSFQVHLLSVITNVRGVPLKLWMSSLCIAYRGILVSTIPSSAPLGKDLSTGERRFTACQLSKQSWSG